MQALYLIYNKGYKLINTIRSFNKEKSLGQGTALPKPLTIQERRNFKVFPKFRKEYGNRLWITHYSSILKKDKNCIQYRESNKRLNS